MNTDPMRIGDAVGSAALDLFLAELGALTAPRVLELGTLQQDPPTSTHHGNWLPAGAVHVRSDVEAGPDVDVVADAHHLTADLVKSGAVCGFDAAIAVSVWEHLRLPWICASELRWALRRGGVGYVATHHAFPVHGYPSDFTRWTDDGLAAMFEWAGFEVLARSYWYPCLIVPPMDVVDCRWNPGAPAYLNVDVCVRAA